MNANLIRRDAIKELLEECRQQSDQITSNIALVTEKKGQYSRLQKDAQSKLDKSSKGQQLAESDLVQSQSSFLQKKERLQTLKQQQQEFQVDSTRCVRLLERHTKSCKRLESLMRDRERKVAEWKKDLATGKGNDRLKEKFQNGQQQLAQYTETMKAERRSMKTLNNNIRNLTMQSHHIETKSSTVERSIPEMALLLSKLEGLLHDANHEQADCKIRVEDLSDRHNSMNEVLLSLRCDFEAKQVDIKELETSLQQLCNTVGGEDEEKKGGHSKELNARVSDPFGSTTIGNKAASLPSIFVGEAFYDFGPGSPLIRGSLTITAEMVIFEAKLKPRERLEDSFRFCVELSDINSAVMAPTRGVPLSLINQTKAGDQASYTEPRSGGGMVGGAKAAAAVAVGLFNRARSATVPRRSQKRSDAIQANEVEAYEIDHDAALEITFKDDWRNVFKTSTENPHKLIKQGSLKSMFRWRGKRTAASASKGKNRKGSGNGSKLTGNMFHGHVFRGKSNTLRMACVVCSKALVAYNKQDPRIRTRRSRGSGATRHSKGFEATVPRRSKGSEATTKDPNEPKDSVGMGADKSDNEDDDSDEGLPVSFSDTSEILHTSRLTKLLGAVPMSLSIGGQWVLKYSITRDGASMDRFYNAVEGIRNTMLIFRDQNKNVFGGFSGVEWKKMNQHHTLTYYGSTDTFVWSFDKSGFHRHGRTGKNDFYVYSTADRLAFGGGDNHAFQIDGNFRRGTSGPSETFDSPCFTTEETFECRLLEVWGCEMKDWF